MFPIKTILHPTDFSEYAEYAFQTACALAREYGAKLIVLHVTSPPAYIYGEGIVPPEPDRVHEHLRERLTAIQPTDSDVKVEHILTEGDAVKEILRVANDSNVDLIVMGTHGRGALMRLLMGSVAEPVVRRATCPVLTVKKSSATISPPAPAPTMETNDPVGTGSVFGVWP